MCQEHSFVFFRRYFEFRFLTSIKIIECLEENKIIISIYDYELCC